jgi:hypothetical protein
MNVRSCLPAPSPAVAGAATFLALFTALPALLGGAGAAIPGAEAIALAQQPGAPPDSVTQIARQRYNEGVKAYDAGKYEDARTAFLQAYALKKHPAVLLNLGQSELRSNHPEDAGNHFQQFLREHTGATPEERATAEKGIAEAKKKASLVVVSVDAAGADVSIDGTTIGKSPLYDPVFIKPGKHTVFATLGGKSAAAAIDAKVGVASQATLTLGVPGAVAPPPPTPPLPTPAPPPAPPPAPSTAPPPGPPPGLQPITPPISPPPGMMQPMPPAPQEPESFGHWYRRKPIAWVGTGIAGVGLIMGIAGGASALSASSSANSVADQIKQHRAQFDPTAPQSVCGDQSTGTGVYPGYEQACQTLRDNISLHHRDMAVAVTGWVLFGVGVAGTAIYTFIDWYPNRNNAVAADDRPRMAVTPIITPTFKGFGFAGSF